MQVGSVGMRPRAYQRLMPPPSLWKTLLLPERSLLPNSSTPHGRLLFAKLPHWLKLQKEISYKWHHYSLSHQTAYVMTTWQPSTQMKHCNLFPNSNNYLSYICYAWRFYCSFFLFISSFNRHRLGWVHRRVVETSVSSSDRQTRRLTMDQMFWIVSWQEISSDNNASQAKQFPTILTWSFILWLPKAWLLCWRIWQCRLIFSNSLSMNEYFCQYSKLINPFVPKTYI